LRTIPVFACRIALPAFPLIAFNSARATGMARWLRLPSYSRSASSAAVSAMTLWEARRYPRSVAAVFLDARGFSRRPDPAPDWAGAPPVADRRKAANGLWRLIGGLNALTGQVNYLDAYIVGRAKVTESYGQLAEAYPWARRLYVIQDNWSIHTHPDVSEALSAWPQVEPVWLPTYAPRLNPMEKLWRWLKQGVLKMHRLAEDWVAVRGRVREFLGQFAHGSQRLLEYVGLLGSGRIAQMIHGP
jgi:transposase